MDQIQWEHHPDLDNPVLIAAFSGWNDAGDAASGAVRYLAGQLHARSFATIEPEDFFDFSQTRPIVRLDDGVTREIEWPTNRFTATGVLPGQDIIFLHGTEPQLKWKTFCGRVREVAEEMGVDRVITLGSLLTDVPHTRPAQVTAATNGTSFVSGFHLTPTQYEGPTGITGVLNDSFAKEGFESTSLWVSVPHYVGQTPSPKAMLALVRMSGTLLQSEIDTDELEKAAEAYEQQISQLVSSDDEIATYVAELEENDREAEPETQVDTLVDEAEEFLRGQNPN